MVSGLGDAVMFAVVGRGVDEFLEGNGDHVHRFELEGDQSPLELLREQNQLLGALVQSEGLSDTGTQPITSFPFDYSIVPPGTEGRLGVPAGRTTIDFTDGTVTNENESGDITDEVRTLEDISDRLDDAITDEFRSCYAFADVNCAMRLESRPWHEMSAANYFPIPSQGFRQVEFESDLPFELEVKASTRTRPFDVSAHTAFMPREGQFPQDSGTAPTQQDAYTPMFWQPADLSDSDRLGDFSEAMESLDVSSYARATFVIENDSGNGNAIDVRLVARGIDPHDGTFREIEESLNIADGDHDIFDVSEQWHYLRVEVRNNTNGQAISASGNMFAGSP